MARERCNLSLSQLASISRLTDTTMQSIEDGKKVNEQIVYRVAGYLIKTYRASCYIDELTLAQAINVVPSIVTEMERGTFNNPYLFRQSINALDMMMGYKEPKTAIEGSHKTQKNRIQLLSTNGERREEAKSVKKNYYNSQKDKKNKRKDKASIALNNCKVNKKNDCIDKESLSSNQIRKTKEKKTKRLSSSKVWEKNRKIAQAIMAGTIVLPKPPAIYPEPSFLKQRNMNINRTNDITDADKGINKSVAKSKKSGTKKTITYIRTTNVLPSQLKQSNGVHGDYETL